MTKNLQPNRRWLVSLRFWMSLLVGGMLFEAGCTSMGPKSIEPDRFNYNNAVANSWKQQMLLNIVRSRYGDAPVFIEISQIISGYTVEQKGNLGWNLNEQGDSTWLSGIAVGGETKYTDRPTITYYPMTGSQFVRNMMTPISPELVFFMIQSGWPADFVMRLVVQRINGLENRWSMRGKPMPGDQDFFRLVSLFREIQDSGIIGVRMEESALEKGKKRLTLFLQEKDADAAVADKARQIRELLGLEQGRSSFRITFGGAVRDEATLSLLTRPVYHILVDLAGYVEVPPSHIAQGQTVPSTPLAAEADPLIQVQSSIRKPSDAFAAVQYEGYWYWIEKYNQQSKKTLSFMVMLLAISEKEAEKAVPLVTIPAG